MSHHQWGIVLFFFPRQTTVAVRSRYHLQGVTLVFKSHIGAKDGLGLEGKINGSGSPLGGELTDAWLQMSLI